MTKGVWKCLHLCLGPAYEIPEDKQPIHLLPFQRVMECPRDDWGISINMLRYGLEVLDL